MAGRHRRPSVLRRAFSSSMARLLRSREQARHAALVAEIIALRVTVVEMREALAQAEARTAELAEQLTADRVALAAAREQLVAPVQGPALPLRSLELPLVRLAVSRTSEVPLTREMAEALASPDRGADTASTELVLANLPERPLLDPKADRDSEPVDHATADRAADEPAGKTPQEARRIA